METSELIAALSAADLADLRKSGLSDQMIAAMAVESLSVLQLRLRLGRTDIDCDGYAIPYFDPAGTQQLHVNYRLHVKPDSILKKYMMPTGQASAIYFPPGLAAVLAAVPGYLLITEGEKKAARAVQSGIPCVALQGVWNWMDADKRAQEKRLGLKTSYATPVMPSLLTVAGSRQVLLAFDADIVDKPGVRGALTTLRDALLFQQSPWARELALPVDRDPAGKLLQKGLDDVLCLADGESRLQLAIQEALGQDSERMSPLFVFPYRLSSHDKPMYYLVPNTPRHTPWNIHQILKQTEETDDAGKPRVVTRPIARTRVWLNRVVQSIDGDDMTLFELAYVPLDDTLPRHLSGTGELLNLSGRSSGTDPLTDRGARILAKERPAVEEFLHDCHTYGVRSGAVSLVKGTRRRGWVDYQGDTLYVMAGRVITADRVFAASAPGVPILPIDNGREADSVLREALTPLGDAQTWREAMIRYVLPNPVPSLVLAASLAGLLRHWCPDSENFILHLYSESSSGKSTALAAGASLWGNPARLIDRWRSTDNGLEGRALARDHMALFLDEAGQAPNEDVLKNAVYMLGNGGEKMRATRDGSERRVRKFHLVALSNGEESLLKAGRHAGQEVRALDLPTHITGAFWDNSIRSADDAEAFAKILTQHHGHGAEPAIQALLAAEAREPGGWGRRHGDITAKLRQNLPAGAPPHIVRRVKHYGLLLTAYVVLLQNVLGLDDAQTHHHFDQLYRAVATHMLTTDGDQFGAGEQAGMLEHFLAAVAREQGHFRNEAGEIRLAVWGAMRQQQLRVLPTAFAELCKPYDAQRVLGMLIRAGALEMGKTGNRKISTRLGPDLPPVGCYSIDLRGVEAYLSGQGVVDLAEVAHG